MRRTLLLVLVTAVVTSLVTSVTVSAATSGREASAPSDRNESLGARLPVIVDTKVDCGVPPRGRDWPNQDALEDTIRCLEDEVININRFMKAFFRCARILEITQYGSTDGTSGYEFVNPGATTPILTTAIDFTFDPTTEPFNFVMLWQNTSFCLS